MSDSVKFCKFLLRFPVREISSFKLHKFQAIFHLSEIISEMIYEIRSLPIPQSEHTIIQLNLSIELQVLLQISYCTRPLEGKIMLQRAALEAGVPLENCHNRLY